MVPAEVHTSRAFFFPLHRVPKVGARHLAGLRRKQVGFGAVLGAGLSHFHNAREEMQLRKTELPPGTRGSGARRISYAM